MNRPLLMILALGLTLRLVWALVVPVEPVSDSAAYDTFARNLAGHGVFGWTPEEPGAYWAVGASAAAAATYVVLGETYWGVVALNLISAGAAIVFAGLLGARYFGRAAGLWSAAVMALWPNLILFTTILSSEIHFIALTLGGLWAWERAGQGPGARWGDLVLAGAFWGAACYMRPVILLFPVALVISAAAGGIRPALVQAGRTVVVTAVILALVAPWTMRNARVFGEPVLMSTNFGANFWMGNNPETDGGYMPLPEWVEGMGEVERSGALMDAAMKHVREEPGLFLLRTVKKAVWMYAGETIGVVWNEPGIDRNLGAWAVLPLKFVTTGFWFAVLLLGLGGLGVLLAREGWRALLHPAFAGWSYFTAIHAVVVAGDRYHMPAVPFVALFAGLALATLYGRFRAQPMEIRA